MMSLINKKIMPNKLLFGTAFILLSTLEAGQFAYSQDHAKQDQLSKADVKQQPALTEPGDSTTASALACPGIHL